MLDPIFTDIALVPSELCDETVWHNLAVADELMDVNHMSGAIMAWIRLNRGKTLADLEKDFRKRNFYTRVISIHYSQNDQFNHIVTQGMSKIVRPDGQPSDYVMWLSCRPEPYSTEELQSFRKSQKENLELLEQTGVMTVDDKSALPKHEIMPDKMAQEINSVGAGTLRIVVTKMPMSEKLKNDIKGKNFEKRTTNSAFGDSVTFYVKSDGTLASKIGFTNFSYIEVIQM